MPWGATAAAVAIEAVEAESADLRGRKQNGIRIDSIVHLHYPHCSSLGSFLSLDTLFHATLYTAPTWRPEMASHSREDVGNLRGLGIEEKAGIDALEVTACFPIPCPRSGADRVHVADGNCMLNRTRTRARRRAGGWTPQLNTWVSSYTPQYLLCLRALIPSIYPASYRVLGNTA